MATARKGFEIALDNTRNILRVRAWGAWDPEFAKKFVRTMKETISEKITTNGHEWGILADFRDFSGSGEVQDMIQQQFSAVEHRGVKKIGYLGEQSVIQVQLNRLFQESTMLKYAFFESEEEAMQWLLNNASHT